MASSRRGRIPAPALEHPFEHASAGCCTAATVDAAAAARPTSRTWRRASLAGRVPQSRDTMAEFLAAVRRRYLADGPGQMAQICVIPQRVQHRTRALAPGGVRKLPDTPTRRRLKGTRIVSTPAGRTWYSDCAYQPTAPASAETSAAAAWMGRRVRIFPQARLSATDSEAGNPASATRACRGHYGGDVLRCCRRPLPAGWGEACRRHNPPEPAASPTEGTKDKRPQRLPAHSWRICWRWWADGSTVRTEAPRCPAAGLSRSVVKHCPLAVGEADPGGLSAFRRAVDRTWTNLPETGEKVRRAGAGH